MTVGVYFKMEVGVAYSDVSRTLWAPGVLGKVAPVTVIFMF
jgi:hypothetical protein